MQKSRSGSAVKVAFRLQGGCLGKVWMTKRISNIEYRTRNIEYQTRNIEYQTRNIECQSVGKYNPAINMGVNMRSLDFTALRSG